MGNNQCILCGEEKSITKAGGIEHENGNTTGNLNAVCKCPPAITCTDCKEDLKNKANASLQPGGIVIYRCPYHSHYRQYQDSLVDFKNWCLLWVALVLIPFGLTLFHVGIDLNWLMSCGAIMAVPSFPGVILSLTWTKVTAKGLITGSIVGFLCGLTVNLLVASVHFEMRDGFFVATSLPYSVVGGSMVAGTVSLVLTVIVSFYTHDIRTKQDEDDVWENLRNLDNPLQPWSIQFVEDFPQVSDGITRPTQTELENLGRTGKLVSIGGAIGFFLVFIAIIPGSMSALEVLSIDNFKSWTYFITSFLIVAAFAVTVMAPLEEIYNIVKTLRGGKEKPDDTTGVLDKAKNTKEESVSSIELQRTV